MQKPPPVVKLAWWKPPERFIDHPIFIAIQMDRIEPYDALSMGSSTLQRRRKAGRKRSGISIYEQIKGV